MPDSVPHVYRHWSATMSDARVNAVRATRVTLIEDVITTGGAVPAAAEALRERPAEVTTVVCAIDRSSNEGRLEAAGVSVRSVLTLADLDRAHRS
ncbi:hypothetical protein CH275_16420 [Rhodococcus sp. 06-235-1A]|nr:hypothetical protein CH275_16420 [Rhodococcus sp. 06-235-1A]